MTIYTVYIQAYKGIVDGITCAMESDSAVAFALDGIVDRFTRPLQRIIEYRFFLRRVFSLFGWRASDPTERMDAFKKLTSLIATLQDLVGFNDTWKEITRFEDQLDTASCLSIGPEVIETEKDQLVSIFTYLAAPFTPCGLLLGSPTLVRSDTFSLIPIKKNIKVFEKLDTSLAINLVKSSTIQLHLLTDTLVITAFERGDKKRLLYPPMPTSHVDVVQRVTVNGIHI